MPKGIFSLVEMVPLVGIELRAETLIYQRFGRGSIPVLLTLLLIYLFAVAVRFFFCCFLSEKCRASPKNFSILGGLNHRAP